MKDSDAPKDYLVKYFLIKFLFFFFLPNKHNSHDTAFLSSLFKFKNLTHKFLQTNTIEFSTMISNYYAMSFK